MQTIQLRFAIFHWQSTVIFCRYMYWAQGGSGLISKIERSDMDGTNRIVITRLNFLPYQFPNGLALDKEHNRLYFVDDYSHNISFVSLGTRARTTVLTRPGYAKGTVIHGSFIYWTETQGQGGAVFRAGKASGKSVEKVVGGLHGPKDICVYDANDTDTVQIGTCR